MDSKGKNECLDTEIFVFAVEVPSKEHGNNEFLEAKKKEIENQEKFGKLSDIEDESREKIIFIKLITYKVKNYD